MPSAPSAAPPSDPGPPRERSVPASPSGRAASVTRPDLKKGPVPEPGTGRRAGVPGEPAHGAEPRRWKALADAFIAEFVGSATWRATLSVLDGAFPGLGMAATLSRTTDELWQTMDVLGRMGAAKLGVPAWLDEAGMVFDLSAHLHARESLGPARTAAPRVSRPYAGAFVVDTLDPLRYHRAVGGPVAPGDSTAARAPAGEEDDSGAVIVADLASAEVRVLDSAALWRYAGRVVAATLLDPAAPETRARARRALRALRRVVFVDPALGLGVCLQIDVARTPRCLLAFGVDRAEAGAPRFVRP
ncbi:MULTISPECIES: hypothetical protein [Actinomadura]|uniref:Uncharacterized protein n=1 Tax=Actinomadura yumaensis TaxID=111807 RepID=A0ABW2CM37_9ACTN|nr:hypothetical protein [Actinomadura sp. J1-007]MWK34259.1 hypothetical protein [Actinomadura sp. J1-007]